MTSLLEGQVAIVTGAASGIGRASALFYAREGAKVMVADVDQNGANETVGLIRAAEGQATFIVMDVSSRRLPGRSCSYHPDIWPAGYCLQ